MEQEPRAQVKEIDGQLVLDDPEGLAVLTAVGKHNCRATFDANAERVAHFVQRSSLRAPGEQPCVMVILNVDNSLAGELADVLMPGTDWQAFRAEGQIPFARGLAAREGIQKVIDEFDGAASAKLRAITDVLPVVVMDHNVIEVFRADGREP